MIWVVIRANTKKISRCARGRGCRARERAWITLCDVAYCCCVFDVAAVILLLLLDVVAGFPTFGFMIFAIAKQQIFVLIFFAAPTRQFQNCVIYVDLDNVVCIHVFTSFPICRFSALDLDIHTFLPLVLLSLLRSVSLSLSHCRTARLLTVSVYNVNWKCKIIFWPHI